MTARYTESQMTTSQVDTYINLAYTLHFPEEFKNIKLTKPYVLYTVPNVDTYAFPYEDGLLSNPNGSPVPGNIQITPPVYCQGYILRYFQDKTTFYNRWPKLTVNQQIGTGDGEGPYSGTIPSTPFLRAQLDIFGNVTEPAVIISYFDNTGNNNYFTDEPAANSNTGDLVDTSGTAVGTVNYLTGAWTLNNDVNITSGDSIYASVVPYQSSRPTDVIFYNQQITFRPVPQQVYQVEFQVSQTPTQMIADTDSPELDEWYLLLCCIASKLIYTDFPDPEGMGYVDKIYQEQVQRAQRRTLKQLSTQRAATIFSQPGRPLATWFLGTEYSGTSS
jgi:hypothetical protein